MVKDYMAVINLSENESDIRSLTTNRPIASIPIGSRYRIIDFVLSNLVNSGVTNVGIFTESNSRSLTDHIGTGKPWDLNRKIDGVFMFNHGLNNLTNYDSKLLRNNVEYIYRSKSDNVILTSSYMIANVDISEIVKVHERSGKDVTTVYTHTKKADEEFHNCFTLQLDGDSNVAGVGKNLGFNKEADICMEMFLMKKSLFVELMFNNSNISKQSNIYNRIFEKIGDITINAYKFDGYVSCINTITSYYRSNMDMLKMDVSNELFRCATRPIYTKIKDEPPALYVSGCSVANSLIADGCIVKGEVKNSLLGRYCRIEEGATVDNCIVLQNVTVKKGAKLSHVIIDKNVIIESDSVLKGNYSFPLVIEKKNMFDGFN